MSVWGHAENPGRQSGRCSCRWHNTLSLLARMTSSVGSRIACDWQWPARELAVWPGWIRGKSLPIQVLLEKPMFRLRRMISWWNVNSLVCLHAQLFRSEEFCSASGHQISPIRVIYSFLRILFSSSAKRSSGGIY